MTKVVTATTTCKNCGEGIDNPRHNQKFCNTACRQEAYRKRQAEVE